MDNNLQDPQRTEEVDLGQLFNAIGRMFKRFFDFIGSILYGIFLGFVWLVFFIKRNIVIILIAIIGGLALGYGIYKFSKPTYQSSAVLKQNYPIGENLYGTLNYYNELISEGDSISLAESLDITPEEAAKVKGFSVSTHFTDKEKLVLYNRYMEGIDTSYVDVMSFKQFTTNLQEHEFELQKVMIKFSERGLFQKTLNNLVKNLESIEYFQKLQEKDLKELDRTLGILEQSLSDSDSLQRVYQEVLKASPELRDNQTSITIQNTDEKESTTKEYQLYLNDIRLRRELVELEREKEDLQKIVEVISVSQNSGTRYSSKELFGYQINIRYYYAVLFTLLATTVLLVLELLKYLERFKNKI